MIAPPPIGQWGCILATDALEIGKAAEHLVCADLILQGFRAYLSDQGLPYDLVVDIAGRLIRVQVKATLRPRNANASGRAPNHVYVFNVRRRGKGGQSRLSNDHCEIVALVGLDTRMVAYLPVREVASTMSLYPTGHTFKGQFKRSRYADIGQFPFREAIERC